MPGHGGENKHNWPEEGLGGENEDDEDWSDIQPICRDMPKSMFKIHKYEDISITLVEKRMFSFIQLIHQLFSLSIAVYPWELWKMREDLVQCIQPVLFNHVYPRHMVSDEQARRYKDKSVFLEKLPFTMCCV